MPSRPRSFSRPRCARQPPSSGGESVDPRVRGISIRRESIRPPPRGESVRRCLNACLVGVLTLSLSMNAARACWFLRQGCHARHQVVVVCPPAAPAFAAAVADPWIDCCSEWGDPVVDACGEWPIVTEVSVGESLAGATSSCECDGGVGAVESETLVEVHDGVSSVVGPSSDHLAATEHPVAAGQGGHEVAESIAAPQPTLADPVAEKPAPVAAAVPHLEPTDDVRQAVALLFR